MSSALPYPGALHALPPVWPEDVLPAIQGLLAASPRKVFILDDDPTGTQTVRDLMVVTDWKLTTLQRQWESPEPGCFILTNSRALTSAATQALHTEIGQALLTASAGRPFSLISRSDSTLRGHYPTETDALEAALGGFDLTVLAPYFKAGGRLTLHGEHYLAEGEHMLPVAQTPFARDPAFAFSNSYLPAYVAEKTSGRIPAQEVIRIDLETLRQEGPAAVAMQLTTAPKGAVCVVDACEERDIQVFALAALKVETSGKRVLYRCAASFVAARLGQALPPLLTADALRSEAPAGGLIVVGSFVPKTTAQLAHLQDDPRFTFLELSVEEILDPAKRDEHLSALRKRLGDSLREGNATVLHTSRKLVTGADATASLAIGELVSKALIQLVSTLPLRPRFLIAKGGITSSDLATKALGVREARIRGQIIPGVPVWEMGPESRFPGLTYVVFPGNVGGDKALIEAAEKLI